MTNEQKTNKQISDAYLEITLKINESDRAAAADVYLKYKKPFLKQISGAISKELLIRTDDVQVLHGFDTVENANAYLTSEFFKNDVVKELSPLLGDNPDIKIYSVVQ